MFYITFKTIFSSLRSHQSLVLENIALRQQLDVLQRNAKRPRLKPSDRVLWALFSRFLPDWRRHLTIVQPKTVVAWHRKGWRLYWKWKSRSKRQGRPTISVETRDLIRRISHENPLWGAPRIHGELNKLGIEVGETTVARYMIKCSKPPSQTWRTFSRLLLLENLHGRMDIARELLDLFAENVWTILSCSIIGICGRSCASTSITITSRELIWVWKRTVRFFEPFKDRRSVRSEVSQCLADCIIGTFARLPEQTSSMYSRLGLLD